MVHRELVSCINMFLIFFFMFYQKKYVQFKLYYWTVTDLVFTLIKLNRLRILILIHKFDNCNTTEHCAHAPDENTMFLLLVVWCSEENATKNINIFYKVYNSFKQRKNIINRHLSTVYGINVSLDNLFINHVWSMECCWLYKVINF